MSETEYHYPAQSFVGGLPPELEDPEPNPETIDKLLILMSLWVCYRTMQRSKHFPVQIKTELLVRLKQLIDHYKKGPEVEVRPPEETW